MEPDDAWLNLSALGDSAHIQDVVQRCLAAIDRVHRFPSVPQPISVLLDVGLQAAGRYIAEPGSERILIRPDSYGLTMTILHEIGHVFDHYAAGGADKLLTDDPSMRLSAWWRAVSSSQAYRRLRLTMLEDPLVNVKVQASYLLRANELFARCYAQYIAVRSEDEVLAEDLAIYQVMDPVAAILPLQWTNADFAVILDELDHFLEVGGWLHRSK